MAKAGPRHRDAHEPEEWLEAFDDQKYQRPELDPEQVKKEGFGPEAHLDESDPNHQTKMVT